MAATPQQVGGVERQCCSALAVGAGDATGYAERLPSMGPEQPGRMLEYAAQVKNEVAGGQRALKDDQSRM